MFRVVRSYDYNKANCPRQRVHRSCGSTGSRGWVVREPGWSHAPSWVARTRLGRLAARLALLGYLAPRRRGGACWVDDATLEARTARSVANYRELARAWLDLSARRSTGLEAGAGSPEVPLARGTSPTSRSGRKWQDRRCTVRRKKKSRERVRVRRERKEKKKKERTF